MLLILIVFVAFIYLISMQGITCCNSGSLYALTRAIVDKKKLSINEYLDYTKYLGKPLDYAKRGKNYYTDRPPGLSFAAVPFYLLKLNVVLVPVISGILTTILVYLFSMYLVNNELIAFSTALIFAFCTLNWRYSTTFLIHSLSSLLVLLAVYLFVLDFPILLIGFIIGIATIVEYTDCMYAFGIFIYLLFFGNLISLPFLLLGYFIGIIPLLIYNAKCFGSPFTTSYKYSGHFKWSNSFKTTFVTPMWKGMLGLLFFFPRKKGVRVPGGLLVVSPVLIFGILGMFYLSFANFILFLLLTLPLFLLISKHKTWWAGGAGDYRYLSSMIPLLVIPISLVLKNLDILSPLVFVFAILSLFIIISRMITLTISEEDLKRINPHLVKGVKKRKLGLFAFFNLRYISQILDLIFECIFIRKIHLERTISITSR